MGAYPGVLVMAAVVASPRPSGARDEGPLRTSARQVGHPDRAGALPKVADGRVGAEREAEHGAHHRGVIRTPAVVADCAPDAVAVYLNSPLGVVCAADQPNGSVGGRHLRRRRWRRRWLRRQRWRRWRREQRRRSRRWRRRRCRRRRWRHRRRWWRGQRRGGRRWIGHVHGIDARPIVRQDCSHGAVALDIATVHLVAAAAVAAGSACVVAIAPVSSLTILLTILTPQPGLLVVEALALAGHSGTRAAGSGGRHGRGEEHGWPEHAGARVGRRSWVGPLLWRSATRVGSACLLLCSSFGATASCGLVLITLLQKGTCSAYVQYSCGENGKQLGIAA